MPKTPNNAFAEMTDDSRKELSSDGGIIGTARASPTNTTHTSGTLEGTHAELLEQARDFLNEESIRTAPRHHKVAFLEKKGLGPDDIQKLLASEPKHQSSSDGGTDLKTVYDSNTTDVRDDDSPSSAQSQPVPPVVTTQPTRKSDVAPVITYPEFLLKPQKPPPLVTFQRLAYATYALAGVSALTYGASKYLVEPMLETLTDARRALADTTMQDLEKLNQKLESTVSHVPYIASSAALKAQHDHDDDLESVDSDPTELFHRDVATQTSPQLSRSSSSASLDKKASMNTTNRQVSSLTSLHDTLQSLVSSIDPSSDPFNPTPASKSLRESITQFQAVLDKLEATYDPFRSDYSSVYSSYASTKVNSKGDVNEATKFKNEIRGLKGAFLSSRNFPSARPLSSTAYGR